MDESECFPPDGRDRIVRAGACMGLWGGHSAAALLAELCGAEVCAQRLLSLLESDPLLCGRVLRVANSALYGQSRSVQTPSRALLLLGLDAVRGIAAAACLSGTLDRRGSGAGIDLAALLLHSHATAVAAEALARIARPKLAAEAFTVGLLHNLGVALQLALDPAGLERLVRLRRAGDRRPTEALEAECAVPNHPECVRVILEEWQLSGTLCSAMRFHHCPAEAPPGTRDLAGLLGLAAALAQDVPGVFTTEVTSSEEIHQDLELLDLGDGDLHGVAAELPQRAAALRAAVLLH